MSRNILIAEDETFIANRYKEEMERHEAKATIVGNGKEAIEALGKEHFDLILLDLLMPVLDGYHVLAHLKEKGIRIPVVVVVTNLDQDLTKERCRELGAEDFLIKSDVDAADVWEKVKVYLPVE